jgi:hypothetical protein
MKEVTIAGNQYLQFPICGQTQLKFHEHDFKIAEYVIALKEHVSDTIALVKLHLLSPLGIFSEHSHYKFYVQQIPGVTAYICGVEIVVEHSVSRIMTRASSIVMFPDFVDWYVASVSNAAQSAIITLVKNRNLAP